MKKKVCFAITVLVMAIALIGVMVSCTAADSKYLKKVSSYTFWSNTSDQAIPQTAIHDIVTEHMNMPSTDGKVKKAAIIGFDGARADGLVNILKSGVLDKDGADIYSGDFFDTGYSALNSIVNGKYSAEGQKGNMYFSFSGGEKGTDTQQYTSTAPSWTAQFTGVWGKDNGVINNDDHKKIEYKSFLLKLAEGEQKLRTSFGASWGTHFTESYVDEIEYLKAHTDIDMKYQRVKDDKALLDYYLSAVTEGNENERDVVFGIFEHADHMGHSYTFGNGNYKYAVAMRQDDNIAFSILEQIRAREAYKNGQEDWLILITTDHGGLGYSHGGQSLEERTTWIATNKTLDTKYYSKGYNGYKCKG